MSIVQVRVWPRLEGHPESISAIEGLVINRWPYVETEVEKRDDETVDEAAWRGVDELAEKYGYKLGALCIQKRHKL